MFFIGPNHGIPRHHLCKFAPKNDKFHGILAKKTEFSHARKSWIKKILLHAKNQLSSSKIGHFRSNFISRQNLDFSIGVPATVQWVIWSILSSCMAKTLFLIRCMDATYSHDLDSFTKYISILFEHYCFFISLPWILMKVTLNTQRNKSW